MNTEISFAGARLTISAVFSIAMHALIMLLMAGMFLFPVKFKPSTQLDVVLAIESEAQEERHSTSPKPAQERRLHTQGNAQWRIKPGTQNDTAMFDQRLKRRRVSEASHESRDSEYLARWRDRVESLGTQYYQSRIKQSPLSGEVRILVSIGKEGQLLKAQVQQSSGETALDAMAMEIVRKSAPFEPLPEAVRVDTDVLEILRTWKFTAREGLRAG